MQLIIPTTYVVSMKQNCFLHRDFFIFITFSRDMAANDERFFKFTAFTLTFFCIVLIHCVYLSFSSNFSVYDVKSNTKGAFLRFYYVDFQLKLHFN